jgi:hypothetical protein
MSETSKAIDPYGQPTFSDPVANIVISIVASMKCDYKDQFIRLYPDNDFDNFEENKNIQDDKKRMDSLRMLKRRLYKLIKDYPQEVIVDGYENCIAKHPEYMPSIPSIVSYIAEEHVRSQKLKRYQDEVKQLDSLPKKKQTMTGTDILHLLNEALQAPTGKESERLERLKAARESHDALIADHTSRGFIRTGQATGTLCKKCDRPGVLTNSITGSGNWYCNSHFHQM